MGKNGRLQTTTKLLIKASNGQPVAAPVEIWIVAILAALPPAQMSSIMNKVAAQVERKIAMPSPAAIRSVGGH